MEVLRKPVIIKCHTKLSGNKVCHVCSVSGCKLPPSTPMYDSAVGLGRSMLRFVSASLEANKQILLPPCFLVFLLFLYPCCRIAPTLPYLVANNIPLFCPQLSQTELSFNPPCTQLLFLIMTDSVKVFVYVLNLHILNLVV